ncbi:MAG TPA: gliding motility-associated C-terminal domain-containing protein, partial [Bacteroidia bacterium]|nr:gliding motility-associated C-terminal domain-containing protein [Bacteroidia bacterium]
AYTGYVKVGNTTGIANTTYVDNNNGAGLINGIDYCYMIVATFADGAESYASVEVCTQLKRDLPVITNVSINTTNATAGQVYVAWSKPTELDTTQTPGPYKYVISGSSDFTGGAFALIDSFFDLNDTILIDDFVNTQTLPRSYKIEFYNMTPGNTFKIGQSQIASSIFLNCVPTDEATTLSWNETVPWSNTLYTIYRQNTSGIFDSIGTSATQSYTDTGLVNGNTYCYKIRSTGNYSATGFVDPIINFSQEQCAIPVDNVAPCTPALMVNANCIGFNNVLSWHFDSAACYQDIAGYNVYYKNDSINDLVLLVTLGLDTNFLHDSLFSIAGCYQVTAFDSLGNESALSNKVCVDNCPVYELPNIFSPNDDGKNDTF